MNNILTQIFPFYQCTHMLLHYSSISSNREVSESAAVRSGGGKENRPELGSSVFGWVIYLRCSPPRSEPRSLRFPCFSPRQAARSPCSAPSGPWEYTSAMAARTLGTSSLAGPSTPRIPSVRARLDSLPSSAYLVSSLPCFHGPGNHQTSPRSTTGSERARESGTLLTISYSRQCADRG